jgi:uncharacterized coiled-coil protein SlyX
VRILKVALMAGLLMLAVATGADAKTVKVTGNVLASPSSASGGKLSVPVLLPGKAQRSLRVASPLVYLLVAKKTRFSAPGPSGKLSILPTGLRNGDQLSARVKQFKRTKKGSTVTPALGASSLKVVKRDSLYSNDELARLVFQLAGFTVNLSGRVDLLEANLAALKAQLNGLLSQFNGLPDIQAQIQTILSRLTSLESLTTSLQTTVNGLTSSLATLQGTVTTLQGTVATLQTNLSSLQSSVSALQTTVSGLTGDVTTINGTLGTLQTTVSGLQTSVTNLTNTLDLVCNMAIITVC